MNLPDATEQEPACGACCGETYSDGYAFVCEDCQLSFDSIDLGASFLNPDTPPCGAPCENFWHGDNKARQGLGFDCGTCQLPAGHKSFHWTGCQSKELSVGEAS